jgi:alkylhydroperoxidase/carboxymuconolactone decarboxylase family protein YurZ
MEITAFSIKQALHQLEADEPDSKLSSREKHLVGLAVTLTRGCQACTRRRINQALSSGLDIATIEKLVDLVAAVNAGVVLRTAVESANRDDADVACTDGICDIGTG